MAAPGTNVSSHYHLGYDFMLEPSRQLLSAGPCLTNRLSTWKSHRDQRVERSRVIALQGKLKSIALNLGQSQDRAAS